jgi:prepilin-type N-terminal cleavage/methylation domain-containing protein
MSRREAGFTLIEVIVTLVLVGIMSAFAGMFITTFLEGYFTVKHNSEAAMKAQMALDRMSLELKDISPVSSSLSNPVSVLTTNTLITYTNSMGANRTIGFAGSNIYLATPANRTLIDNVESLQLSANYNNVYNIAANDVAYIDIGFTTRVYDALSGSKSLTFNTRIFPRNRIPHPP